MNDISKDDLKNLGELLENDQSAIVVISESRIEEIIVKELKMQSKNTKKEFNADVAEYNTALNEMVKEI